MPRHAARLVPSLLVLALGLGPALPGAEDAAPRYSWQGAPAKVLPQGDLAWAPEPFAFVAGASVRYIDFAAGSDDNDGASKATPWKHHPWDANAAAKAKAGAGIHTYVFKRGVAYRGRLAVAGSGEAGNPIRLTSDPAWGQGEAEILGSEVVTGWQAGGHPKSPEPGKIWRAELPFAPRLVCAVAADGTATRLKLARMPNWEVSDPNNTIKECWAWENPDWWLNNWNTYRTNVNGKPAQLGVDTKHLTADADTYLGALVWSEWGIVMGAPGAAPVEAFDAAKKAITFQGYWYGDSGMPIATGHRYWLEDKPQFLDQAGEFWFEKKGEGGTLYVRLPGDADPATMRVEAARHTTLIDAQDVSHLDISGLAFRFGNIAWNLDHMVWQDDVATAAVRMLGSGTGIAVHHCRFEHLARAVIVRADGKGHHIGAVRITDNDLADLDHGGILVSNGFLGTNPVATPWPGDLDAVAILRNRLRAIGFRPIRGAHTFTIHALYPQTAEIAGNIIDRSAGAGIMLEGGRNDGGKGDTPFARYLVHHNRVEDALLLINDYGAIETNQGGPFYVYDNVVRNAVGMMNWAGKTFGHAYYVDGGFKAFHFNNIAWGRDNDLKSPTANASGFQEIISYQNTYFHNSLYRLGSATRRQAPQAGRDKWLGNAFEDISSMAFRHSDAEGKDPNAKDAGQQVDDFAYETNAQTRNLFHAITGKFGVFAAKGGDHPDLASYAAALNGSKALAGDVGAMAPAPLFSDPAQQDFRPAPGSAVLGQGVRVFVPWSLYGTVGEWNFIRNRSDPALVLDEHWYLKPTMTGRDRYHLAPTYPLHGVGVGAQDYIPGALEDWADGALRLDGKTQYLTLANVTPPPLPPAPALRTVQEAWFTATLPQEPQVGTPFTLNLTLEKPPAAGVLRVDLNCIKGASFGGWLGAVIRLDLAGPGPYVIPVTLPERDDVSKFLLTAYVSPDGSWDKAVSRASIEVGRVDPPPPFFDPQIAASSFIVEAYVRIQPGSAGVLVEKASATAGHSLTVDPQGRLAFSVRIDGTAYIATSAAAVADGAWHHLLAESDRAQRRLTIYVDGKSAGSGAGPEAGSLANPADLYVGGTPGGRHLAVTLDFLRFSRGSLADARTTIEELCAWQFDGPFLRDFSGIKPAGKRDAGALQGAR